MQLMNIVGYYFKEKDKIVRIKRDKKDDSIESLIYDFDDEQERIFSFMCDKYVLPLIRADNGIVKAKISFDKVNNLMIVSMFNEANKISDDGTEVIWGGQARCLHLAYHKKYAPADKELKVFNQVECVDIRETYLY